MVAHLIFCVLCIVPGIRFLVACIGLHVTIILVAAPIVHNVPLVLLG